jgi:polyphenol oxidase
MSDSPERSDPLGQLERGEGGGIATRRGFLKASLITTGLGLIGGLTPPMARAQDSCAPPSSPNPPVPFKPDTSVPILPRKSAASLTSAEIQKLKDAYKALRQLTESNPNDPRGWMQQANVHCFYCGGNADGSDIHQSYRFFAWHRCYLYFHERILGKLINDPTFRLPYWDWSNTNSRTIPKPYTNPNDPSNPLFDANRGATPTDKIPAQYVSQTVMNGILRTTRWQTFMGTNTRGGNLENGPHGIVHIWVGDPTLQDAVPDMGVLETAARDPLFFTHHSNIDRYWAVWLAQGGGRTNPTDPSWPKLQWTFYDENSVLRSITAGDVVNFQSNLRYSYPGTTVAHAAAQAVLPVTEKPVELSSQPVTLKVAIPPELHSLSAQAASARPLSLHLAGIEAPGKQPVVVHVFANNPKASAATSLAIPSSLGYFAIVPSSLKEGHQHGKREVTIEVGKGLIGQNQLSVTLVPAAAGGKAPKNTKVSVDSIYLSAD